MVIKKPTNVGGRFKKLQDYNVKDFERDKKPNPSLLIVRN